MGVELVRPNRKGSHTPLTIDTLPVGTNWKFYREFRADRAGVALTGTPGGDYLIEATR